MVNMGRIFAAARQSAETARFHLDLMGENSAP
jgi:hypothetical protein